MEVQLISIEATDITSPDGYDRWRYTFTADEDDLGQTYTLHIDTRSLSLFSYEVGKEYHLFFGTAGFELYPGIAAQDLHASHADTDGETNSLLRQDGAKAANRDKEATRQHLSECLHFGGVPSHPHVVYIPDQIGGYLLCHKCHAVIRTEESPRVGNDLTIYDSKLYSDLYSRYDRFMRVLKDAPAEDGSVIRPTLDELVYKHIVNNPLHGLQG